MKRIFIGLRLADPLSGAITAWQTSRQCWPVRWVKPHNVHVTLMPPWHTDQLEPVIDKLQAVPKLSEPLDLRFDSISLGPNPREPRLVWAVGQAPPPLVRLVTDLYRALGQELPRRPFKLHATLARLPRQDKSALNELQLPVAVQWQQRCDTFALLESHLLPDGAEYRTIQEFPLT